MAIDVTVGTSTSESYVSVAEADAYFADRQPSTEWDALDTDAEKEKVLKTAARRLDQERFQGHTVKPLNGTSTDDTQALAFPRYEVESREGWTYLHTVIPEGIKRAQMEIAYAILSGDLTLAQTGLEGFERAKVGPIDVEVRHQKTAGELPRAALRELDEFLVSSGPNVRMMRS